MKKANKLISVLLVLSLILSVPGLAMAEDAVTAAPPAEEQQAEIKITDTFTESFDNGLSNWAKEQGTGFAISKNEGLLFNNMKEYLTPSYITAGKDSWSNYNVTLNITPKNGDYAGLLLRYKSLDEHYVLQFAFTSGRVSLLKKVKGGMYTIVKDASYKFKYGTTYKVVANLDKSHITVSMDDVNVLDAVDASIGTGKIGIRGFHSVFSVADVNAECFQSTSTEGQNETNSKAQMIDFGLDKEYAEIPYDATTKERFLLRREEIGEEIPVPEYMEPKGKIQVYVAPTGSDKNPGTIDKPFKTIAKALQSVVIANKKGGAVIWLRGGFYEYQDGLTISGLEGDPTNPIFIAGYPGEEVKFVGAKKLDNSKFEPVTDKKLLARLDPQVRDKVRVINLKKQGFTTIPEYRADAAVGVALYMDSNTFNLARYPDVGYAKIEKVVDEGPVPRPNEKINPNFKDDGRGFTVGVVADIEPLSWENTGDIWIRGGLYYEWHQVYTKINIDKEKAQWDSKGTYSEYGVKQSADIWYYNVFEELNFPGEFYIDKKTSNLYLYPIGEITDDSEILFSTATTSALLVLENCKNVVVSDITFEAGNYDGIGIKSSQDVLVQRCNLRNFGDNCIEFNDSKRCGITHSRIMGMGNRAAYSSSAGSQNWDGIVPHNNFVMNTAVFGHKNQKLNSLVTMSSPGDITSHNLISNGYATGAGTTAWEGIIEYNEIVASPKYQYDSGGTYGSGAHTQKANHIRFNYIHDILPGSTNSLTRAIYYDNLAQDNMTYGNIMYKVPAGIFYHGGSGNTIFNNISISLNKASNFAGTNSRNMINPTPDATRLSWSGNKSTTAFIAKRQPYFDQWLIKQNLARKEFEEATAKGETPQKTEAWVNTFAPIHFYYANNVSALGGGVWLYEESPEAPNDTTEGLETNYTCEGDPFVDSANQNFNIKPDSEIYKAIPDFEAPNFDNMGLLIGDKYMKDQPKMGENGEIFAFSPADGDEGTFLPKKVQFMWTDVEWANRHRLEVATDPEFKDVIYDETTEYEYATVELDTYGKTYYWRVTAITLGKSVDKTPLQSKVFSFRTATEEEAKERETIVTAELNIQLDGLKQIYNSMVEGTTGGTYVAGTKAETLSIINAATEISRKPDSMQAVTDMTNKIIDFRANLKFKENYGYRDLPLELKDWELPATDQFFKEYNAQTGELMFEARNGMQNVQTKMDTPWRQITRFQMKMDKVDLWWGMTSHWDPLVRQRYFYVMQPQTVEFQIARTGLSRIVRSVVNDNKVIVPGQWHEIEIGVVATDEGVWNFMTVDGKELFSYIDTKAKYTDGKWQLMLQPDNGKIYFRKSQSKNNTPPEIPTVESLGQTDPMEF